MSKVFVIILKNSRRKRCHQATGSHMEGLFREGNGKRRERHKDLPDSSEGENRESSLLKGTLCMRTDYEVM